MHTLTPFSFYYIGERHKENDKTAGSPLIKSKSTAGI